MRVAVFAEYRWLLEDSPESGGRLSGPAWLLANIYARQLGVRLETVQVEAAYKVSILRDGSVDLTLAPLLHTPARAQDVDLVDYSETAQCLFGLKGNRNLVNVHDVTDLDRHSVVYTFVKGTPQESWLKGLLPAAVGKPIVGSVADIPFAPILSHKADIAPIDKFFAAAWFRRVPGLVTFPEGQDYMRSTALAMPISLATLPGQAVFTKWLRAVALENKALLAIEQDRVVKGPAIQGAAP